MTSFSPLRWIALLFAAFSFSLTSASAIDVDAIFQAFGFEKKSTEEKAKERFRAHLSNGDIEKAIQILTTYADRSRERFKKSPLPIKTGYRGIPSPFFGPWDVLFYEILESQPEEDLPVLLELLGRLYGPEYNGAGFRYSHEAMNALNRAIQAQWMPKGGDIATRLDDFYRHYEPLSDRAKVIASYQLASYLCISNSWDSSYKDINRWVETNEASIHPTLASCLRAAAAAIQGDRSMGLNGYSINTYNWDAIDRQISAPLEDESAPLPIRFALAYRLLTTEHPVNCKTFLAACYRVAERCETELEYPPSNGMRYEIHHQTALFCISPEVAQTACDFFSSWAQRLEKPGEIFPAALLSNNELAETLKVFSMAGRKEEGMAFAKRWLAPWMKHDLDVIFPLIELGLFDEAKALLPAGDEDLPGWRGGRLRHSLAQNLPEFYTLLDDSSMELRIEGEIASRFRDDRIQFSPPRPAMERTRERLPFLKNHIHSLSDRSRVRVWAGFGSHAKLIPEFADYIEDSLPADTFEGLFLNNSDLSRMVEKYIGVRFTAAFLRKDWELARSIMEEVVALKGTREGYHIKDTHYWICILTAPHVMDAVLTWDEKEQLEAAEFWKWATESFAPMDTVRSRRQLFFGYTQLFQIATSSRLSKDKWFGSADKELQQAMERELRSPFCHSYNHLWYARTWSSSFHHPLYREDNEKHYLDVYLSHPAVYQLDQWNKQTYRDLRRIFDRDVLESHIADGNSNFISALFLAQARCKSESGKSEEFEKRNRDLRLILDRVPEDRSKSVDLLKRIALLALAKDCIENNSLEEAAEILESDEDWKSSNQLKKEYDQVKEQYEEARGGN